MMILSLEEGRVVSRVRSSVVGLHLALAYSESVAIITRVMTMQGVPDGDVWQTTAKLLIVAGVCVMKEGGERDAAESQT